MEFYHSNREETKASLPFLFFLKFIANRKEQNQRFLLANFECAFSPYEPQTEHCMLSKFSGVQQWIFVCSGSSNMSLNDWHVVTTEQQLLICLSLWTLATTILLCPFCLTTLDASAKWNHAAFVPLWLACFPQHDTLWVHSFCQTWQDCLLFKDWLAFHLYYVHTVFSLPSVYEHSEWFYILNDDFFISFSHWLILQKSSENKCENGNIYLLLNFNNVNKLLIIKNNAGFQFEMYFCFINGKVLLRFSSSLIWSNILKVRVIMNGI